MKKLRQKMQSTLQRLEKVRDELFQITEFSEHPLPELTKYYINLSHVYPRPDNLKKVDREIEKANLAINKYQKSLSKEERKQLSNRLLGQKIIV